MKKKKLILIGSVDAGHPATGGETMKNQLFLERFRAIFDRVTVVDTFRWQRRPWRLLHLMAALLFNRGANVVISSSPKSAHTLLRFLNAFRLKKNVWYWVVGGSFHEKVREGVYDPRYMRFLRAVIVQGPEMVESLKLSGVGQAVYVPNSKPMNYFPVRRLERNTVLRFVFLSRITPEKGCDLIVESVRMLNEKGLGDRFTVDFYGEPDKQYESTFRSRLSQMHNVFFRGYLNMRKEASYDVLAEYDVMLFPTFWQGEGFPGVVLDAYIAGLPVIASDWNLNRNVIREGQTGRIVEPHNAAALCSAMEEAILGRMDLQALSDRCRAEAVRYDYRKVLDEELFRRLGLI